MGGPSNTGRLVQSTLAPGKPGNLHALVLEHEPLLLAQYSRDPVDFHWRRDSVVTSHGTASGCLIQSNYEETLSNPGNFEAVVVEGRNLVHYSRRNSVQGSPWQRTAVISSKCLGPASLIQARFIGNPIRNPGHFQVVVLEDNEPKGKELVLYTRDNAKPDRPWQKGVVITTKATGPGSLIQNTLIGMPGATGNYELVVLEGTNLVHYWRDNHTTGTPWHRGEIISAHATGNGPGSITQSTFGASDNGNLNVVVLEGQNLVHYWCDRSRTWQKGAVITTHATGPGSIIQIEGAPESPVDNFEVIVVEDSTILAHYSRDNSSPTNAWVRRENISEFAIG
jgi:hypothetical protein